MINDRRVLSVRQEDGYEVRTELVKFGRGRLQMESAYTAGGHYIGNPDTAELLRLKYGIVPELSTPNHKVCSIGFSEQEQKWYGWSHRAIFGFGVGSVVKKGDCCASSGLVDEYLRLHPEEDRSLPVGFEAKTLDDAKRMAIAFADSVG